MYKCEPALRFLVRAFWDRRVQGEASHLFEAVEQAPLLGERMPAQPQVSG